MDKSPWIPKPDGPAKDRQKVVLSGLRNGRTIDQATAMAGVTRAAHHKWAQRDPSYKIEVERARNMHKGRPVTTRFTERRVFNDAVGFLSAWNAERPGAALVLYAPYVHTSNEVALSTMLAELVCIVGGPAAKAYGLGFYEYLDQVTEALEDNLSDEPIHTLPVA